MYKWIGSSTYPRRDGSGSVYVIFLAEQQPDGQFRPFSTYSGGRTAVGSFVPVEVYNAAMALKLKLGDDCKPTWGPRGQIESLEKG